ncbi:hypothetical protein H6G25_15285 [Dolichospermum sp. FACHB-1091]|uniref:hypothetical protein n=1 Tax=Dolichospermum sp. FACHB-1091 TaxID=2692798 RepID=UPI0016816AF8|nr:hypothetical protein [Dolichospermum sp. FACHB-1091]MBD2444521.1 hypothetical protein [Dolichospermum sp. FACHB-1091]
MFNNPFSIASQKEPTQFEKDIEHLVEQLKSEVNRIHDHYKIHPNPGTMWIYGSIHRENQEMLLFRKCADHLLLEMYSHEITETEPKSISEAYQYIRERGQVNYRKNENKKLALELAIWIDDVEAVSVNGTLNDVIKAIESLESRLSDFKHFKHFKPNFLKSN